MCRTEAERCGGGSRSRAAQGPPRAASQPAVRPSPSALQQCRLTTRGMLCSSRTSRRSRTTRAERNSLSRVLDWLYIGNQSSASDTSLLTQKKIRFVLRCCAGDSCDVVTGCDLMLCNLNLRDLATEKLADHLPTAFAFLAQARVSGKGCLVHCAQGVSRSPAIVLAYLVAVEKYALVRAWELVCSCRRSARPNPSFVGQLMRLDGDVHGRPPASLFDLGLDERDCAQVYAMREECRIVI